MSKVKENKQQLCSLNIGQLVNKYHRSNKKSLAGVLSVKVLVLDANDNKPQFDKNMYELWVEENTPPGTVLLDLHAEDRDEGTNGQVSYNLSFNSFQEFGYLIGIGEESGQLYLKGDVDYEKGYSTVSLSVVAQDKGNDPLQSFASVLVHIQDVNDNQPIVTVTTLTPSGYAEVSEDVEASVTEYRGSMESRWKPFLTALEASHMSLQKRTWY